MIGNDDLRWLDRLHTNSSTRHDIDDRVDRLFIDKTLEANTHRIKKHQQPTTSKPRKKTPLTKIILPLVSVAIIVAMILSILPIFYGGDFDISVSIEPLNPVEGDLIYLNATIPASYNITDAWANISGIKTINLTMVANTTVGNRTTDQLWQGTWFLHNLSAGDHLITISAIGRNQTFYQTTYRWLDSNVSGNESEETPEGNVTQNETTNDTLSLDLWTDKQQYTVNETIALHGLIYYNETLINTSVNFSISGPNLTTSHPINASNGTFNYSIRAALPGDYVFEVNATVGNTTIQKILQITVTSNATEQPVAPPGNFTARALNTTTIHLSWSKGRGSDTTYVVRNTEGYPEHTADGIVLYNGTAPSYNDTNLTQSTSCYYAAWGYNRTTSFWSTISSFASASTLAEPQKNTTTPQEIAFSVVPDPNPPDIADKLATSPDHILVEQGMNWNKYYDTSSGHYRYVSYLGPVNYQDEEGQWHPILCNVSLLNASHPAYEYGYRAGNERGLFNVYFKPDLSAEWPIAFAYGKSNDPSVDVLRSKLVGVGYLDPSKNWQYEYLQSIQSVQPSIQGSACVFPNVFSGMNITWRYTPHGLKEEIVMTNTTKTVLQNAPPSTYGFSNQDSYLVFITKLDYQNLLLYSDGKEKRDDFTVTDGQINFKDVLDDLKFFMPVGNAYELHNKSIRQQLTYRFVQHDGEYYLLSGIKVSDLNHMEFPVVIDPSIDTQIDAGVNDAYENDAESSISRTAQYIRADDSTTDTSRYNGGLFFSDISIPNGAFIDDAYLEVYTYSSGSHDDPNLDIYCEAIDDSQNFLDNYDVASRTTTENSTEWTDTNVGTSTWIQSPDFTDAVQEVIDRSGWSSGNNLTVLLKGKNENVGNLIIWSYEYSSQVYGAKLNVEYSQISTAVDAISPYQITSDPLAITATNYSAVDNVTLYYRHSLDNNSWNIEEYTTGNDDYLTYQVLGASTGTYYQTFTIGAVGATRTYNLTNIDFLIKQSSPGGVSTLTCTLYPTDDNGQPDTGGGSLTSGSGGVSETSNTTWEWRSVNFDGYTLQAGETYAMKWGISGTMGNSLYLANDTTSATYPGGSMWYKPSVGAWQEMTDDDVLFELHGDWQKWDNANNPDTSSPWQWSFDFPDGAGYYEFYSIGNKSGVENETPPDAADAICYAPLNTTIDTIIPYNVTTPSLTITASNNGLPPDNVTLWYRTNNNTYEYYKTGGDADRLYYTGTMLISTTYYQTFTIGAVGANETFNLNSIKFLINIDSGVERLYCKLYPTIAGGQPNTSGGYLIQGSGNVSAASTADYEWWAVDFGGYELQAGTTYAMTWSASGTGDKYVYLRYDSTSASYSGGSEWTYSAIGGWTQDTDDDYLFELQGDWQKWNNANNPDTSSPWSWNFDFPNSTGYYEFYSIGKKAKSVNESTPGSADAFCYRDNTTPSSSVKTISPYWNNSGSVELSAYAFDGYSGVKNVTLWYRYSSDNSSWGGWVENTTDTDYDWNWTFTFPNGSGYYEFYSIACDNASNEESSPGIADTFLIDSPGTTTGGDGRQIVRTSDGTIHIIYYNSTDDKVMYARSYNDGMTWDTEVLEDNPYTMLGVAIDSSDNLHFCMGDYREIADAGAHRLWYKNGTVDKANNPWTWSWGSTAEVADARDYGSSGDRYDRIRHPHILVDSNDYIHIVWTKFDDPILLHSNSTDGGSTWGTDAGVDHGSGSYDLSVDIDPSTQDIWVSPRQWSANGGNGYTQRIQYNGGTSWTINARSLWGTNYRQDPSIVVTSDGYLYLTYWHSNDNTRYVRYTPIPTLSWSSDYAVHNDSGGAHISRGHNSTEVYILFRSDTINANYDIFYRTFWRTNNSLSGNISITNDNTGHDSPSCVLGPYGTKIDFVWRQGTSSPYSIYYGRIIEGRDAVAGSDNQPPSSSIDTISPYVNSTGLIEITATASDELSGVKNVTLWYRYSSDNSSWGGWVENTTDTDYDWNWTFTFPNGTGYYEFYSIATDNFTNIESAPGSADVICLFDDTAPSISFDTPPTPANDTETTDTYAQINVTVSDSSDTSSFINWDNSLVGYWSFEHTNATHVFDNSTYGNNGTREYTNITGIADVAATNETQCVDDDTLQTADDVFNGWTFMATSGLANGNTTIISDYEVVNESYRALYFQDTLTGFNEGDSYALWLNTGLPNLTTGKFGSALSFDSGDYVDCGNDVSFDITDEITIEAWVNYGTFIGWPRLVSKSRISAYALRIMGTGKIELAAEFGGVAQGNDLWSSSGFNQGEWSHVVATYNGTTIQYYINGADAGTVTPATTGPIGTNSLPLCIGGESPGTAFLFNGSIDEVRVWNRVLSWEEINASYNSSDYKLHHNFTGLSVGNYSYYAHAIDVAGNENTTETRTLEILSPEPTQSSPSPSNGATNISIIPVLNVTVDDADGDTLTAYWYSNSSGGWALFATNNSIDASSGSVNISQINTNFSNYGTICYWSVNLTDGTYWCNETYHFTTGSISTSVDAISPYEIFSSSLTINATAQHNDYDNVTLWYRYSSDNSNWGNASDWWNASWKYRKKLTIDHNQVDDDLTDFPILVSITDMGLANSAQDDGDDVVFTNITGTKLNHEIESFNGTSGTLIAWVNVTSLSASVDTEIYLYFGNTTCISQQNVAGTWDGDYVAVWHFNNSFNDSSGNNYNGTNTNMVSATGIIAGGMQNSDAEERVVNVTNWYSLNDQITAEIWLNLNNNDVTYPRIFMEGPDWTDNDWGVYLRTQDNYELRWLRVSQFVQGGNVPDNYGSGVGGVGYWWYLWGTYDEDGGGAGIDPTSMHYNKTVDGFDDTFTTGASLQENHNYLLIGNDAAGNCWDGRFDEARISKVVRSNEWMNTTYNTIINTTTFLTVADEEGWMQWSDASNPDTSSPWQWNFSFPNGTGYYEFYSIGKKSGSTDETSPPVADAICHCDPSVVPIVTTNASTGVEETNATLHGYLSNDGGENCTVWFEYGTTISYGNTTSNQTKSTGDEFSYNLDSLGGYQTEVLRPNAAGSLTQCAIDGNDPAPTNWESVDEVTSDGDDTYVKGAIDQDHSFDLYNVTDSSIPNGATINSVTVYAMCKKEGAAGEVKLSIKENGVKSDSGIKSLPVSWGLKSETWTTRPSDGQPWTKNDVDSLEIGIGLFYWDGLLNSLCTQIYAEVNYSISLAPGTLYHYRASANNSVAASYGSDMAFLTKPNAPTNFNATSYNSTQINLTWVKGTGANNTYIEYNTTASSWPRGQGTMIYNDTGTSYEHTGLAEGTTYYYQIWSYTTWTYNPTVHQWSDENASANNKTNTLPTITPITPKNGSTDVSLQPTCQVWANDSDGDTLIVNFWQNASGAQTFEQYTESNSPYYYHAGWYEFQTFTIGTTGTNATFECTDISPYVCKYGNPPNATFQLRETNATGHPLMNSYLASKTITGASLPSTYPPDGTWNVTWDVPVELSQGTTYAIVAMCEYGDTDNDIEWHTDTTSPTYSGGVRGYGNDTAGFTLDATDDHAFEVWGEWVVNQTNTSVSANSTVSWGYTQASSTNTTYWWKVTVDDGLDSNASRIFHFTTEEENISFDIAPPQWDMGSVDIGDINETTGFYFNLTNEGNVALDITINATHATNSTTGAQWNLTTPPAKDNFSLWYKKNGDASWTNITTSFTSFVTNLAADNWKTFDLKLLMATTSSTTDPLGLTVTFKSVAS